MTTLYITRHGETEWNTEGRMQGWNNSPLTYLGKMQAEWLRDRLKDVDFHAIYSSTLERAYQTAEIVKGQRNIEVIKKEGFKEISLGNWEGLTSQEIEAINKEQNYNFWKAPHLYIPDGGEHFHELIARTHKGIKEILENHKDENVLVVTHGVTLKAIMLYFEDKPLERLWDPPFAHQTSLTVIEADKDKYNVLMHGDTAHYR
ncbi:histidine phosphatase family protein [Desnuesiella massiliensis]|uniref:histidine phosphatase family protein n=1 Tax=Desnuesiella massiliensis TaxID=1650662 RepID=UPI0006E21976|nr:histidine phosphatase family protein [Desnuesiella massiliensis]